MKKKTTTATHRFILFLSILLLIIAIGVIGYTVIEKASFIDALYMTIITLSTVGYGEVFEGGISLYGKMFTIIFILIGISLFVYALSTVVNMVIEGHLTDAVRRRKMQKQIAKLKKHYVICGLSAITKQVISDLLAEKIPLVIIDKSLDNIENAQRKLDIEINYIIGNPSDEETLSLAGIEKAKGIICCSSEDAENGFTILTAKELNQELFAITVCNDETSEKKLKKMGADRVILPNFIGGKRIAGLVLRPEVLNFLDIITKQDNFELFLEEIQINSSSSLANTTLKDSNIRQETDAIVIGIKHISGSLTVNPKVNYVFQPDDKLIVLGEDAQLQRLKAMASS